MTAFGHLNEEKGKNDDLGTTCANGEIKAASFECEIKCPTRDFEHRSKGSS